MDRQPDGFWRIIGARTKWDTPCAIWQDGDTRVIKWGRKDPIPFVMREEEDWWTWSYPKARAVTQEDWEAAVRSGEWTDDGKPARQPTKVADEPAKAEQSNYASTAAVITERLNEIIEAAEAIGSPILTSESAAKANEIGIRLRAVLEEGTAARNKELAPVEEQMGQIKSAWQIVPYADGYLKGLRSRVRDYLKREEQRLANEAKQSTGAAPAVGADPPPTSSGSAAPVDTPKITSQFGRAVTLRTARVGVITDEAAFIAVIRNDKDFQELLQKKANAYARAQTAVAGMTIEEVKV
jgi:hypothetical protein